MPKLIKKYQTPAGGLTAIGLQTFMGFQNKAAGALGKGISPAGIIGSMAMDLGKAFIPQAELTTGADDVLSAAGDAATMFNPAVGLGIKALDFANRSFGKTTAKQQTSGLTLNAYQKQTSTNAGKKGSLISTWFGKNKLVNKQTQAADEFNSNAGALESAANDRAQAGAIYAQDIASNNQNQLMSGLMGNYKTKMLSAKDGAKLDDIRKLISSRNKSLDVKKFQDGGKLNVIPEGALHARKNNLPEEIAEQVTDKGIPVITYNEGGDITQHAEIEANEIIFAKDTTNQLEEYFKQYQENPSDELAIKCGKFLTEEILENTDDRTGLLEEIE